MSKHWSESYTREELAEILFAPEWQGSMTRDAIWLNIHMDNFARSFCKAYLKGMTNWAKAMTKAICGGVGE